MIRSAGVRGGVTFWFGGGVFASEVLDGGFGDFVLLLDYLFG